MADREPFGSTDTRVSRLKQNVGPIVLVIDDDAVGRSLISETLRPVCSRVIELNTPIGATLSATREGIDVVVLDIEMPNLRGDMVAKLFRKNPRLNHVGVILVSGSKADELASLARVCGADAAVSKRQIRTGLGQALHTAWSLSRSRAAARSGMGASLETPETGTGVQRGLWRERADDE